MVKSLCVATILGLVVPAVSVAAPITYSYTGTVYQASGASNVVNIGDQVSGSFTVDFANGNSWQSTSPSSIGTYGYWAVTSYGAANTLPRGLVFSLTAQLNSFSYLSGSPGPLYGSSGVESVGGGIVWQGWEAQEANLTDRNQSNVYLYPLIAPAYNTDGLPNLSVLNLNTSYGAFAIRTNNQMQEAVTFRFNNIQVSSVPEPESYALMLAGLGMVGVMARRRKSRLV